jgi:hypothetical protein
MDKYDRMIAEALSDEDRALLASYDDPGVFGSALDMLRRPGGWLALVMLLWQILFLLAAVWAGWHFFTATDPLVALKWGLPAAILSLVALQLKLALMPQLQATRLLRALSRIEVLIAARR